MFERWVENQLLNTADELGVGIIAFSPLAQGLLTDKYINGIPENSRAAKSWGFLQENEVEKAIDKVKALNEMAEVRGQSLAQMAIAWLLRHKQLTSVLVGASSVEQLNDNLGALDYLLFSEEELTEIECILNK